MSFINVPMTIIFILTKSIQDRDYSTNDVGSFSWNNMFIKNKSKR